MLNQLNFLGVIKLKTKMKNNEMFLKANQTNDGLF